MNSCLWEMATGYSVYLSLVSKGLKGQNIIFLLQVVLTKMDKLHKEKHQMMIEEVYKIKERFSLNSCFPHIFALRFVWREDKIHFWCLLQFNWNTIPLQLLIPSSCTQVIAHHTNHNPETSLLLSKRTERERERYGTEMAWNFMVVLKP